ncbi:SIS domain-containing protein [Arthrobacter sp. efr-133-TYG-118]|uniref:MurR/RpiR family transcriptional regulator n=1 Tax=Arthrobacter sp. efr-133-TYG-118 TaxID=3040279 RepID=UPI00254E2DE5|nr:SIS domain-containing protein [Arthrobacter sp. efr-133-TYG-118]
MHAACEQQNLQRLFESSDEARLGNAAELLSRAGRVLIVGFRNSYPLAIHLRQQLVQCREAVGVAPQPGQSLGEEIAGLSPRDAVVLLGFRRRPESFSRVLRAIAGTGAAIVLIGDPTSRRFAADARVWIECPVATEGAFDSYASAMSLMSLLANGVLADRGRPGTKRISAITGLFDSLGEIEGQEHDKKFLGQVILGAPNLSGTTNSYKEKHPGPKTGV